MLGLSMLYEDARLSVGLAVLDDAGDCCCAGGVYGIPGDVGNAGI